MSMDPEWTLLSTTTGAARLGDALATRRTQIRSHKALPHRLMGTWSERDGRRYGPNREDVVVAQVCFIMECGRGSSGSCKKTTWTQVNDQCMSHQSGPQHCFGSTNSVEADFRQICLIGFRQRLGWERHALTVTICQVLHGLPHSPVEGSGVGRALECQAELPVVHLPVVKRGRGLDVDQVFLQNAFQDHLPTRIFLNHRGHESRVHNRGLTQ